MYALYGPDDGCQYLANELREELEIADYYIMQAPRPTLILAGTTILLIIKEHKKLLKSGSGIKTIRGNKSTETF
jgi:hypothetical protein